MSCPQTTFEWQNRLAMLLFCYRSLTETSEDGMVSGYPANVADCPQRTVEPIRHQHRSSKRRIVRNDHDNDISGSTETKGIHSMRIRRRQEKLFFRTVGHEPISSPLSPVLLPLFFIPLLIHYLCILTLLQVLQSINQLHPSQAHMLPALSGTRRLAAGRLLKPLLLQVSHSAQLSSRYSH